MQYNQLSWFSWDYVSTENLISTETPRSRANRGWSSNLNVCPAPALESTLVNSMAGLLWQPPSSLEGPLRLFYTPKQIRACGPFLHFSALFLRSVCWVFHSKQDILLLEVVMYWWCLCSRILRFFNSHLLYPTNSLEAKLVWVLIWWLGPTHSYFMVSRHTLSFCPLFLNF